MRLFLSNLCGLIYLDYNTSGLNYICIITNYLAHTHFARPSVCFLRSKYKSCLYFYGGTDRAEKDSYLRQVRKFIF